VGLHVVQPFRADLMDEVLCCLSDFPISYADDSWLNPEPFYSLEAFR